MAGAAIFIPISIHALREEGDALLPVLFDFHIQFLSTPSARRATRCSGQGGGSGCDFYPRPPRGGRRAPYPPDREQVSQISIHALREEGDNSFALYTLAQLNFYPRPPRGGRPLHLGQE